MDEVRSYHAPTMSGIAAGHPELEYPGIEVTTGPLGQGIANAVGMAIAGKNLGATYNRDGFPVVDGKVWCFTGDGCLQEGVGQEGASSLPVTSAVVAEDAAISMAGHWGLDNLILIYDNNRITVDGTIDNCFTDDTSAKLAATGWHVIEVEDGSNNLTAIVDALEAAKKVKGKPTLVNIRTIIGFGSRKQNSGPAHGQALGKDEVVYVKTQLGFDPDAKFAIRPEMYEYFKECKTRGAKAESNWSEMVKKYEKQHPDVAKGFKRRMEGKMIDGWEKLIPSKDKLPKDPAATRKSSGIVIKALAPKDDSFIVGSADLLESTFVNWDSMVEFQNVG